MNLKQQDRARTVPDWPRAQLTGKIIECFLSVYNALGYGMLEAVYRKALVVELSHHGLHSRPEVPIEVLYRGIEVGFFRLDVLVENLVAVEVKATELLPPAAKRQLLNYLRASRLDVGLLLHFGPDPKVHRLVSPRVIVEPREEQRLPFQ